jgi:hypothetical protein
MGIDDLSKFVGKVEARLDSGDQAFRELKESIAIINDKLERVLNLQSTINSHLEEHKARKKYIVLISVAACSHLIEFVLDLIRR